MAKAIVITGNGTNCEREMAHACRLAGFAVADIVNIWDIYSGKVDIRNYDFLNLPGGFMDGDDLGSAKAGANRIKFAPIVDQKKRLLDFIVGFIDEGKLVLGVCNGFQLLIKLGLIPALSNDSIRQEATLTNNDSARFEDRWVWLKADAKSPCIFTKGINSIELPVRHGEGKLVVADEKILREIHSKHTAPLYYTLPGGGSPTMEYPYNPNGSTDGIAGLCDTTGRVFGMMPHPEAYTHRTNHPRWTREPDLPEEGMGLKFFQNAAEYLKG